MLKPSEAKKLSRLYVDAAGDITPRHLSDLEIWRWLAILALIASIVGLLFEQTTT